jgi:hypothetical protein
LQRGTFTPAIPRSKSCRTTDKRTGIRANPDRHRHLLPAQSHGHPMSHGRTLRVLTTRKEIMSAIWLLPKRKLEPAIRSEPRTTTNTLNITSGRCPRTEQRDSAVAHERASRVTCSRVSDDRLAVLASPTGPDGIDGPKCRRVCLPLLSKRPGQRLQFANAFPQPPTKRHSLGGVPAMLVVAVAGFAPPCIRQRLLPVPVTAADRHGFSDRVLAPHRAACDKCCERGPGATVG